LMSAVTIRAPLPADEPLISQRRTATCHRARAGTAG
jgi:hypothetical protein